MTTQTQQQTKTLQCDSCGKLYQVPVEVVDTGMKLCEDCTLRARLRKFRKRRIR
jgi:predicted nucleic acid-binding Zn ribbon protein